MRKSPSLFLLITITTLQFQIWQSISQQAYVNNDQLDCLTNFNHTNGFQCNGNSSSCTAYVTLRSQPPSYSTPPNIAFLLNSSASAIGQLNNISELDPIPTGRLVMVPVSCSCTRTRNRNTNATASYYQHNARYRLQTSGETYFTMANNTYQGLATCQAMIAQNPYNITGLEIGNEILVPLMCACPTAEQQRRYNTQYLLSYLVTWGDTISQIADMFGVDTQAVLDANELREDDVIFPFTPILVPLPSTPRIRLPSPPPAASPQPDTPASATPNNSGSSSNRGVIIGVGIAAGVLIIAIVSFLVWFFLLRRSKKPAFVFKSEEKTNSKESESSLFTPLPISYTSSSYQTNTTKSSSVDLDGLKLAIGSLTAYKYREIQKATGNFGEGSRIKGSMFRGEFNGDEAAVKVLKGNVPNDEITILKHINHSNIIRLSGYCIHEGNTYLVYEYAEKGSLDYWLFRNPNGHSEDNSLSPPILGWKQRVQIASNIADALNYLHSYINPPYIHKNVKSSNVILDSNYRAKITNFGLARTIQDHSENGVLHLTKHVVGTHGYLAPEYIENGAVTTKLDVFAFGVVILELLSGQPAVKPNNGGTDDLLFVIIRKVFEGENVREKLMEFMDSNLGRKYPLDLAYTMAQLGYRCVDRDMNSRPSMSEVAMTLAKIYSSSLDWDPSDDLSYSSSLSHTR